MIAELGQMALAIALAIAVLQGAAPFAGAALRRPTWIAAVAALARAQLVFVGAAFALLVALFVRSDFSVSYVAQNSNTALPLPYRVAAVWGGHEGSLLLWALMLALWGSAVAWVERESLLRARVLGVMGLISVGFLLLLALTSNPFARLMPAPAEGRDLNPLLQDPGLAIHPPMLYMGYVGFAVAFAFAIAALLGGRMDSAWARRARPWALAAWIFLTLGIALGSWWAYYELGWGGWWFWDPVENASFMPWLVGAALLHSLAATEARGLFKSWTALLAILTFSLCLLGAFLVRSGILVSVHAFAVDAARGLFILGLLTLAVGGALLLYALRAPRLAGGGRFGLVSRESGILINNVFLTVAAFSVLLGTMYPLIWDALGAGKISVGPPYFNRVFIPLAVIPAALAAVGALSRWKRDAAGRLAKKLGLPFAAALAAGLAAPFGFADRYEWSAAAGLALAFWILFATARVAAERVAGGGRAGGGFWGMIVAHGGVAVFVAGATAVSVYQLEEDVRLAPGAPVELGRYQFELVGLSAAEGSNYRATVGEVAIAENGAEIARVHPEKRTYFAQPDNQMTEAGIAVGLGGDWYVSLGEPLGGETSPDGDGAWSARLQYKPWVRLIWGGAALMALGGLLAAADRRYRRGRR